MRLYQVDSFTGKMFSGNPAAVCIIERELPEETMLAIAGEMNLSETAFVKEIATGQYSLRWFTPKKEVNLCGHATLAAAHVLFNELGIPGDEVRFETLSGTLVSVKTSSGIMLDFAVGYPQPAQLPAVISESMGLDKSDVLATMFCGRRNKFLLHLRDPEMMEYVEPDFRGMLEYNPGDMIGVIITAKGYGRFDFISRFFAPWVGVDEDPVTGSSHTVLAPYWSNMLGKKKMLAKQVSSRSGQMYVEISEGRVLLTGNAVTVFRAELEVLS